MKAARAPKCVVRSMLHEIVPDPDLTLEVSPIDVAERTQSQEEVKSIERSVLERKGSISNRIRSLLVQEPRCCECVSEIEGSATMEIVPQEPVDDRSLRADCNQRWVIAQRCAKSVKATI